MLRVLTARTEGKEPWGAVERGCCCIERVVGGMFLPHLLVTGWLLLTGSRPKMDAGVLCLLCFGIEEWDKSE